MIKNAQASDNNGIAELFFVHIFDKITKRSEIGDLRAYPDPDDDPSPSGHPWNGRAGQLYQAFPTC